MAILPIWMYIFAIDPYFSILSIGVISSMLKPQNTFLLNQIHSFYSMLVLLSIFSTIITSTLGMGWCIVRFLANSP